MAVKQMKLAKPTSMGDDDEEYDADQKKMEDDRLNFIISCT